MPPPEALISSKELAALLGRNVSYVYRMRRRGYRMIAGRTTLAAALAWLQQHPQPWATADCHKPQHTAK